MPQIPLPAELLREIIKDLPLEDCQTLALASQATRNHALPFIFGHLRYTGYTITTKIRNICQARNDTKDVIRKLEIDSKSLAIREADDGTVILEFLKSLPNLQTFSFRQFGPLVANLSELITSLRHAPLLDLALNTVMYATIQGDPPFGLSGLEKLSVNWVYGDSPDKPGSSVAHLFALIQPSLPTLLELDINNTPEELGPLLDLQLLKPAGNTLRVFVYTLQTRDESILDTIPEIFPNLTKLSITWDNVIEEDTLLWKNAHILSLAKNKVLVDLTLSSDFEVDADDTVTADYDYAWFIRCYERRLKATQDIALACPKLQRCSWIHMRIGHGNTSMVHPFIVEQQTLNGNVTRVVRGVKQPWMGRDRRDWQSSAMIKCKLEDLPGNIIGENDPPEEQEQ